LDEAGVEPTQEEPTEENLSKVEAEKQLCDETTERGKANSTEEENNMRDQDDLPIDKEEVQHKRMHEGIQPIEQLDRVIKEIRKMMVRSGEDIVSMRKLNRGEPAIIVGKEKK
jgi:hypothetical protein